MDMNNTENNVNICINYYGQPRILDVMNDMYNNYIHIDDNKHKLNFKVKYHILYTTWKTEDVSRFKEIFPSSYIEQIDQPNMENYKHLTENYEIDNTNPNKKIEHYIKGLYVKKMSYNTIEYFENICNINFDFIITLRTDVYLSKYLPSYYELIINNSYNTVYVASQPKFAVYNSPALPDVISISSKKVTEKTLDQLSILEHCTVNGSIFFHPETSFYNSLKYNNLNIIELDFIAFPQDFNANPQILSITK